MSVFEGLNPPSENDAGKVSLTEGNTTNLTPVCDLLGPALKHGPTFSPWDDETVLYGPSEWAEYGVTDGWAWATDGATAAVVQSEKWLDLDHREIRGRAVIALCRRSGFSTPLYAVEPRHVASLGGRGLIPSLGRFDLDRLRDAVLWASADTPVVVACDEKRGVPMLHIAGPGGRAAVLAGLALNDEDAWMATIDLPLRIVTADELLAVWEALA